MGRLGTERQIGGHSGKWSLGKQGRGTKDDGGAPRGWGLSVTRKLTVGRETSRLPRSQIRGPETCVLCERHVTLQALGCTVQFRGPEL